MSIINHVPYNLGFTAASLRPELARVVAESYLAAGDWTAARDQILRSNALQCRSSRSAVRLERELRQRLARLTDQELALLVNSPEDARNAIAWLSAIKHIQFAFDFASEILRSKLATHDTVLRRSDYETYVEAKSISHPELSQLAGSSKAKLRQVLLRMLTEAGLLTPGPSLGTISRAMLPHAVLEAIIDDDPRWLAGFLVPDSEIGRIRC